MNESNREAEKRLRRDFWRIDNVFGGGMMRTNSDSPHGFYP